MKKLILLLLFLSGWWLSANSSTPPATLIKALDISESAQLVLTSFATATYQFEQRWEDGLEDGLLDWREREMVSPASWPEYDGKNPAYGSGHLDFDRTTGEANGTTPFLTPISLIGGQPVYAGTCLMTPEYKIEANAGYLTAYSLSFQVKGAGTLSFLAKLSLDPVNLVGFDTWLPENHLVHHFNSNSSRMIILLDGEEAQPTLESEIGYLETGFEYDNLADEDTGKRPIGAGADWGLYSLEIDTSRYNHQVEILILLPGENYWQEKIDLTTSAGVRAVYGDPTDNEEQDGDFSPCFYRVWFDDFRWRSYEEESETALPLVVFEPDAASEGEFEDVEGESHFTYTFPANEENRVYLDSQYDNIVFMYTLDGSEPTVDADGQRNDSTFLYDDVSWEDQEGIDSMTTRYILRRTDEAGIAIDNPCILKVKAYEKIGESTYLPTDGLTYPKQNLAGLATVYHYLPRVAPPEMQLRTTALQPGGLLQISSATPGPVTFYYTLDGSEPSWQDNGLPKGSTSRLVSEGSQESATVELAITAAATVRCLAVKAGWAASPESSLPLVQVEAPVINLEDGTVSGKEGESILFQREGEEPEPLPGDLRSVGGYFLCQARAEGKLNSELVTLLIFPALPPGWNLLALPGQLLPEQRQNLSEILTACFVYDAARGTYTRADSSQLIPGQPFWIFQSAETTPVLVQITAPLEQLTLNAKWNLAGGIRNASPGNDQSGLRVWRWENDRFHGSASLLPWRGYWLFSPQAGAINSDYNFPEMVSAD